MKEQKKEVPACGHQTITELTTIKVDGKKVRVCSRCAYNHRAGIQIELTK